MAKKVVTKKKRTMNFDELQAYRVAYGRKLGPKDVGTYVGIPTGMFAFFSFILLYNVYITAFCAVLGAIYGFRTLLPKIVKKQYEAEAFNQRNKFINNITQVLTDNSQTALMAIKKVTNRSSGEFQQDLKRFHAMLIGADNERIRDAILWFSERYDDDVIFQQYLEQLETSMIEGKNNIDTLKDIKTYHNEIRKKQEGYERDKNGHLRDMKQLVFITAILIIALGVSFGWKTYMEAFARHIVGYISGALYLTIMSGFFRRFVKIYFDDSVMEVKS